MRSGGIGFAIGMVTALALNWLIAQMRLPAWQVVDLTHPLQPGIPVWPGNPPFELRNLARLSEHGYYANALSCAEHTGTHVDAPIHFVEGRRSMHEVPATQLVGEICVIDVRDKVARNPDYLVSARDVRDFENRYGQIPPGAFVIARTGWEERWNEPKRYVNMDEQGVMHFPGFGSDAAKLLVERNIAGVGIDTLSIDYGPSKDFIAHKILLGANKIAVENMANLRALPPRGATILVGALKIRDGSGAPARVLALVRR
ncbi:MAG: cyclase [Candidatus Fervidibacterota bacterium]